MRYGKNHKAVKVMPERCSTKGITIITETPTVPLSNVFRLYCRYQHDSCYLRSAHRQPGAVGTLTSEQKNITHALLSSGRPEKPELRTAARNA